MLLRSWLLRLFPSLVFLLALAIRKSERRVVRALQAEGATEPGKAVGLPWTGGLERRILGRLHSAGAVHVVEAGKYYLAAEGYHQYRMRRRKRAAVMILVVLVLAGVMWWRSGVARPLT